MDKERLGSREVDAEQGALSEGQVYSGLGEAQGWGESRDGEVTNKPWDAHSHTLVCALKLLTLGAGDAWETQTHLHGPPVESDVTDTQQSSPLPTCHFLGRIPAKPRPALLLSCPYACVSHFILPGPCFHLLPLENWPPLKPQSAAPCPRVSSASPLSFPGSWLRSAERAPFSARRNYLPKSLLLHRTTSISRILTVLSIISTLRVSNTWPDCINVAAIKFAMLAVI